MKLPRVVVSSLASHAGKTTTAAAVAAALAAAGLRVQPFKAGPDYIDPGYLGLAAGRTARNLDPWLLGEETTLELFLRAASGSDVAVIEGVMGLFDGRGGEPGAAGSTAHLARLLAAPVVVVLDARGLGPTAAALARGVARFDPRVRVAGFLLRGAEGDHARLLRDAVETATGLPVLGGLPQDPELAVPERTLGLETVAERRPGAAWRRRLARRAQAGIDLEGLLRIARSAPDLVPPEPRAFAGQGPGRPRRRIALALDAAFQFYYPDSLDVLGWHGVEWIPFSPLADPALPPGVDGVFFGGGFPERHLEALAANRPLVADLRRRYARGLEVYAECGGLMFLSEAIVDPGGRAWPMAALVPGRVRVQDRLASLGYREAEAVGRALFLAPGDRLRGHEFRYSLPDGESPGVADGGGPAPRGDGAPGGAGRGLPDGADPDRRGSGGGPAYRLRDARGRQRLDGWAQRGLLASYLHLHFAAHPDLAARWANRRTAGADGAGTPAGRPTPRRPRAAQGGAAL